jgi:hypothetical protein
VITASILATRTPFVSPQRSVLYALEGLENADTRVGVNGQAVVALTRGHRRLPPPTAGFARSTPAVWNSVPAGPPEVYAREPLATASPGDSVRPTALGQSAGAAGRTPSRVEDQKHQKK